MSNWDDFDARDYANTSVPIGARTVSGVRHMTAIDVAAQVVASTGLTLSTTPTTITIDPTATYALIDLGSNAGTSALRIDITGKWRSGGAAAPVPVYVAGRDGSRVSRKQVFPSSVAARVGFVTATASTLHEERVLAIPVAGMFSIDITLGAGTIPGVNVIQRAGPYPPYMDPSPQGALIGVYPDWAVNGAYATGETLGPTALLSLQAWGPRLSEAQPIIRQITIADYAGILTDFDIVITKGDSALPQADKVALDVDYPEAIMGYLEVRGTPSAGQYKSRNVGASGGNIVVINDIHLMTDYTDRNAAGENQVGAMTLVSRAAHTWSSAATLWGVVICDT